MPINVTWIGGEPKDHEDWEDVLRAEYGTALGQMDFEFRKVGDGWQLARVTEAVPSAKGPGPRVDQRQRFIRALRIGGKQVIGELDEDMGEMELVSVGELDDRTEKARREGKSGE
jgi:hypothetical protein